MTKSIIIISALLFAPFAVARTELIKECAVSITQMDTGKPVEMTIRVDSQSDHLSANISQSTEGKTLSFDAPAEVLEDQVRPSLNGQTAADDLNEAESVVVHAMTVTDEPLFQGVYTTGLDLSRVRSAKVFLIGERTNFGGVSIVEAYDENHQSLGSFFDGLVIAPCRY